MNLSLYVIADEYVNAMNQLMESDLDDTTIADTLESISGPFEDKAKAVAMYIRNCDTQLEAMKSAEKELATRRKSAEKKIESFQAYLKDQMERCAISKIEAANIRLSIKKNPTALEVLSEAGIPEKFWITPPPPEKYLDKATLKAALTAGEAIEGARLTQATRLEIKV